MIVILVKQYANAIQYSYDLNLNLYKSDTSNGAVQSVLFSCILK